MDCSVYLPDLQEDLATVATAVYAEAPVCGDCQRDHRDNVVDILFSLEGEEEGGLTRELG